MGYEVVPSNPWQFIRSFGHSWGSIMSGAASVPFTVMAILSHEYERTIYAVFALVALVVAAFFVWKSVYDELAALKSADISVRFDCDDARCSPPSTSQPHNEAAAKLWPNMNSAVTTFQQKCVMLTNTSGIPIDQVEIYSEEILVARASPGVYSLIVQGIHNRPILLCPGEAYRQGIIREIVDRDGQGKATKRIELTLPLKHHPMNLNGAEFIVKVLVVGRNMHKPKRCCYRFGDRDGELFFEESQEVINS
jgi:hypothetical protein